VEPPTGLDPRATRQVRRGIVFFNQRHFSISVGGLLDTPKIP
jgi:hypothetical protein